MGVLENWYLKAREGVYSFGKKAGKYLDISKMKIKVAECDNAIDVKMRKIGEIAYDKITNHDVLDESDISDIITDIKSLEHDKQKYIDKMNSLRGKCVCKSCNSLNNFDAQFCSSCGNNLVKDATHCENLDCKTCESSDDFSSNDDGDSYEFSSSSDDDSNGLSSD